MKKVLVVLLTFFVFCSCENDDLASKIDESNDLYVFRGIEYYLEEGDSLIVTELKNDLNIAENNDSISKLYIDTKAVPVCDTIAFCFYPDEYLPYILRSNESLMISIPESIVGNEIILSPAVWKYEEEQVNYSDTVNEAVKKEIEIPPLGRIVSNDFREELCVTYVASFVGMVTGNEVKLKGKWKKECIKRDRRIIEFAGVVNMGK